MTDDSAGGAPATVTKKSETAEQEKPREKKERARPPTKVLIRRLPPTLTEETLLKQLSPLADHDYFYFVRADRSLGQSSFSRAYINFNKQDDIFTFKEQFDNYTFVDKKGNEYPAVVEFAPFQRLPKKRAGRKKDPKAGTLEQDPAFVIFEESRTKPAEPAPVHSTLEYFPPSSDAKKVTTTPLLEFLKQRRAEKQRARDERREERRRKEQERKRMRDEERRRRKDSDKEAEPVVKVLRNPDHEREKDEPRGRGQATRKRDDERVRQRDRKSSEPRQRDVKTREPRSYREERLKVGDTRSRKGAEETRRKFERPSLSHGKLSETRKSQELKSSDGKRLERFSKEARGITDKKIQEEKESRKTKNSETKSAESDLKKPESEQEQDRDEKEDEMEEGDEQYDEEKLTGVGEEKCPSEETSEETNSKLMDLGEDNIIEDNMKLEEKIKHKVNLEGEECRWVSQGARPKCRGGEPARRGSVGAKQSSKDVPSKPRRGSLDSGNLEQAAAELSRSQASSERSLGDQASGRTEETEEPELKEDKKDPRVERRIRNKDRPAMQIYRPGMGRLSAQRREKGPESPTSSPSPTPARTRPLTFTRSSSRET